MSADIAVTILLLAIGTFAIRASGAVLGTRLARMPLTQKALDASAGCLIVALVVAALVSGPWVFWPAALVSAAVAILTQNLIATMVTGIGVVALFSSAGMT